MDYERFGKEAADDRAEMADLVERAFVHRDGQALLDIQDVDEDLAVLVQEALDGTPGALLELRKMFLSGLGPVAIRRDLAEAFLIDAAHAGNSEARRMLAQEASPKRGRTDIPQETGTIGNALDELLTERLGRKPKHKKQK